MSQVRIAEKKRSRALWPVIGLLLAVALLAISYVLAPILVTWLRSISPQFSQGVRAMTTSTVNLLFTGLLFLVLGALSALIIALLAPKKAINVKYTDLIKERDAIEAEKKRRRLQQRKFNQQFRESIKNKDRQ